MIYRLAAETDAPFPPVEEAERDPDGLLAVGGDLSIARLLNAYRKGIFPWYSEDSPILWWSPDPRTVLFPEKLKISRSLRKTINKQIFTASTDNDFHGVINACAGPRPEKNGESSGTWIMPEMIEAYLKLHQVGAAHSIEVMNRDGLLVGGLYGIALGRVFFGESMFSTQSDASKVALVYLVQLLKRAGVALIDCQMKTDHLLSLGAEEIDRRQFSSYLDTYITEEQPLLTPWSPTESSPLILDGKA